MEFQSLGRDSGCSSGDDYQPAICFLAVSIPRSGFWVFKLVDETGRILAGNRFNPSVGILGVQAERLSFPHGDLVLFQSLGRDSGCSSLLWSHARGGH